MPPTLRPALVPALLPARLPARLAARLAAPLVDRLRAWPVESQLAARRNAMIAATALAARRAEREDVEEFFAGSAPQERAVRAGVAARR